MKNKIALINKVHFGEINFGITIPFKQFECFKFKPYQSSKPKQSSRVMQK